MSNWITIIVTVNYTGISKVYSSWVLGVTLSFSIEYWSDYRNSDKNIWYRWVTGLRYMFMSEWVGNLVYSYMPNTLALAFR